MEHFGFLFAAYSAIFAAIFLYVVFIWSRQSRLEGELRALESKLAALTEPRKRTRNQNHLRRYRRPESCQHVALVILRRCIGHNFALVLTSGR